MTPEELKYLKAEFNRKLAEVSDEELIKELESRGAVKVEIMKKSVVILRGVSGSGKSSVAELFPNAIICCADDFFTDEDGNYNFNQALLGAAHKECREKFDFYLEEAINTIVVANTNTSEKEWKYYEEAAKLRGYKVFFLVIENRHGNKDVHNVPPHVLDIQENRIREDLKLR